MSGKQPIERISLVAPTPSILTSARPLPNVDWSTGIAWTPSCGLASSAWQRCPDQIFVTDGEVSGYVSPEKTSNDVPAPVATDAFMIYTAVDCEWVTTEGADRLDVIASDVTEVHTAAGIARALWMGTGLPTVPDEKYGLPPTLRRVATDLSGMLNGAAALDDVVAVLLTEYEDCTGGTGGAVLHLPTPLLPGALGGGDGGARIAWPEGSIYRGWGGIVVSPGPGYPHSQTPAGADGAGPLVVDSDPEEYQGNGYDELWVYITGPIEYAVGEIKPPNTREERFSSRTNIYEVIAERQAIVRFDPCCVFAARADNTAGMVS